ncbi:hypothetical protein DO70_6589 [Burkholderia pseudomallei]|nr:hypothetical protein DO70_6589 [Burkholderia pseudomallei]
MEIRHEPVDHAETVARRDEDVGFRARRGERPARLERAHRRRADRDHAAAACAGRGDLLDERVGQLVRLAVHPVLGEVFDAHRLERARADVQRERRALDAARLERGEHRVVEVQAGRRRGDGARVRGEHRLIAGLVGRVGRVLDVRRQRQPAVALDQHEAVVGEVQREERLDALADRHVERIGERERGAGRRALARADLRERGALAGDALDQHLDLAAACLATEEARLEHLRVVEDEQVARRDARGQLGEAPVDEARGRARVRVVHLEQAARAAFGQRGLRDQLGRQIEIEIGKREHAKRGRGGRPDGQSASRRA